MHFCWTGPDAIRQAKPATPRAWRNSAGDRRKQGFGVAVGNWQYRNFRDDRNIFQIEAFGVFRSTHAGRKRITGINRIIGNAAALYAVARTPCARRKSFSLLESVF